MPPGCFRLPRSRDRPRETGGLVVSNYAAEIDGIGVRGAGIAGALHRFVRETPNPCIRPGRVGG